MDKAESEYNPFLEKETHNPHPGSDRTYVGPEESGSKKGGGGSGSGSDQTQPRPTEQSAPEQVANPAPYAETPEASPAYWHQKQANFAADPYIDDDHPGYKDPDGWSKDFVDMVVTSNEKKAQGKSYTWYEAPNYRENDPLYLMIQEEKSRNQAAKESEGQTGEAFKEQPLEQPAETKPVVGTPENPAPTVADAAEKESKGWLRTVLPNLPDKVEKPAAVKTEEEILYTPQESVLQNTYLMDKTRKMYQDIGWSEADADRLANEMVSGLSDEEAKRFLTFANYAPGIEGGLKNIASNVADLGKIIVGINPETGQYDRGAYDKLRAEGLDYYKQHNRELPMGHEEFTKKYAEYQWRTQTGERYDASLDLYDFDQYMPEELQADVAPEAERKVYGANYQVLGNLPGSELDKRYSNPLEYDNLTEEQQQEATTLADNLWKLMGEDEPLPAVTDVPQVQMTQQDMDNMLIELARMEASGKLDEMLNVDNTNGSMENLDFMQQVYFYLTPKSQGTDVAGASTAAENLGHNLATTMMSAGVMGNIGEVLGSLIGGPVGAKVGKIAGWAIGFGVPYTEQLFGYKLPYYDEIMEMFDKAADWVESTYGKLALGYYKTFDEVPFSDPGDYVKDLMKIGKYSDLIMANYRDVQNDYSKDAWDIVSPYAYNLGLTQDNSGIIRGAFGLIEGQKMASAGQNPERGQLKENEVYRWNLGLADKAELTTNPAERLQLLVQYADNLLKKGVSRASVEQEIAKVVSQYMGANDFANEIFYNEQTDPLNLVEGNTANTLYMIGSITGDQNLVNAVNATQGPGTFNFMDYINAPGMDTVVSAVGKALGKEWHKTPGLTEIMAAYDIENKYGNLADTTAFGRKYSGIDSEGKVKGMDPLVKGGNTSYEKAVNGIRNFFDTTNETRILHLTNDSSTYVNMGLYLAGGDPVKINAFLDQLQSPDLITEDSPLYDISHSAMFNTYKEDLASAVTAQRETIDKLITNWDTFAGNRQVLNSLAAAMEMKPEQVLDKIQSDRYNFAKQIDLKAQQNGGTLPGIDLQVDSKQFSDEVINRLAPFTGKNPAPWNQMELTYQISNLIGDGMQKVYLDKYNIQPDQSAMGTVYRFGDTIKAMQNFVFLGISGTYLPNNILNNVVTRGSVGVGGFSSGKTMDNFFERMGVRSERFGDSLAPEIGQKSSGEKTQYSRMSEAIADRKKVKSWMTDVKKAANDVNNFLGIAGKLSGKVEESESKQAIYSGMKQYMDKTWRPGINLERMPAWLENALNAQDPGMADAVYSAIHNNLNMTEINDAVLGDYVQPGLQQSFAEAARQRYGLYGDEVVGQMFEKTGLMDELKEELAGKDETEREKVFEDFSTRLEAANAEQVADHIANLADEVKTRVTLEGFKGAIESAFEMINSDIDVRLGSMDSWTALFNQRLHEQMTVQRWRKAVDDIRQKISTNYSQLYAQKTQIYDGILTGLGMDDSHKGDYITALGNINGLWVDFQQKQDASFREYQQKAQYVTGENEAGWHLRAQTEWQNHLTRMEQIYETSSSQEMQYMEQMDQAFYDGIKAASGLTTEIEFIPEILKQIRDVRQQQIDLNKQIRQQERSMNELSEKDTLWKKNVSQRKHLNTEVTRLQRKLFSRLAPLEDQFIGIAPAPTTVNYDQLVAADINHEEAIKLKAAAEKYSEQMLQKLSAERGTFRPEYMKLADMPTTVEADALVTKILDRIGTDKEDQVHRLVFTAAGLMAHDNNQLSANDLYRMGVILNKTEMHELSELSARYNDAFATQIQLGNEANTLSQEIADRVYPDDKTNRKAAFRKNIFRMIYQIAQNGQANPETFGKVNPHITAADWQTINDFSTRYNESLYRINNPDQFQVPSPSHHTEQVVPYQYGNYTIVSHMLDADGKVIALVPDNMPITEVHPFEDVALPVLGLDPHDPQGIVYEIGDQVRTASPEKYKAPENNVDSTAYKPAMDVNTTPTMDPAAMANQEVLYKDILPLLDQVAQRYNQDLLTAQTRKYGELDAQTQQALKNYLENTVARDITNAKYKAMRFGEMMRDAALLNYSDRYGWDNFMTLLAPYQFWLTRSANNWLKRVGDHPRLFSKYFRMKQAADDHEDEFMPSRLEGKLGIPMPGWADWMGGRIFFNPSQLDPINNFIDPLNKIDDDKHVAERKTITLLGEQMQKEEITYDQYQQAITEKTGPVWEAAYAEASLGEDLDPNLGSLWNSYFSPMLPVEWGKALLKGKTDKLSHFPSTNIGNALGTVVQRIAPDNEIVQRAGEGIRKAISSPERALRDIAGIEYNEFGAYGEALIARRLKAMLTDGDIGYDEWQAAWMEKDGNPVYEQAFKDVQYEMALRVPMMGAVMSVEDIFTNPNDVPLSERMANLALQTLLSGFGEYVYSHGEEVSRNRRAEFDEALDKFKNGDKDALNEYYEKYPSENTNSITNKKGEEAQMRQLLYRDIIDNYYSLDKNQQQDVIAGLPPKFYDAVINKETRAIDTMPLEDLAAYARALNGTLPYANAPLLKDKEIKEYTIQWTPDSTLAKVQEYYDYKEEHFPGIKYAVNAYNSFTDENQKKAFLNSYPPLQQYFDWNKQYKKDNPDVDAYLTRNSQAKAAQKAEPVYQALNATVQGALLDAVLSGNDVPEWVDFYIQQAITESGTTARVDADDLVSYVKQGIRVGY